MVHMRLLMLRIINFMVDKLGNFEKHLLNNQEQQLRESQQQALMNQIQNLRVDAAQRDKLLYMSQLSSAGHMQGPMQHQMQPQSLMNNLFQQMNGFKMNQANTAF